MRPTRIEMAHVPFTGASPASMAILDDQPAVMSLNAGPAEAVARDGPAKIFGLGASERLALLPQVAAAGLASPILREVLPMQAAVQGPRTPEEIRAFIAADRQRWAVLVCEPNKCLEWLKQSPGASQAARHPRHAA